jgi:hypothetical protein
VFFWRFKIVFMAVAPVSMTSPEVVTVDGLGDDRRPVAHQVGDLFDGMSLSLMIETKVWRSSLGIQSSPMPAALVIKRKARRTLPAASGLPFLVQKTRS